MIKCEICATPNRLDGKFCRECGAPLPLTAVDAARQENQRLVDDGYRLLQDGRLEEARLAAETALEREPGLAAAWALRGDAREREGDLAGALEDYEHVVEISPDSTLERLKLTHLRKLLAARTLETPAPGNRRLAVFAGIAATVLVVCVGASLALLNQTPPLTNMPATAGMTRPDDRLGLASPANSDAAAANTNPSTDSAVNAAGSANGNANPTDLQTANPTPAPRIPESTGGATRMPDNYAMGQMSGQRPMLPPIGSDIQLNPSRPPATNTATSRPPSVDEEPGVMPDAPAVNPNGVARPTPPRPNGVVDIRPSAGQPHPVGGSETITSPRPSPGESRSQAEALSQTARQHYQMGDFSRAADAYEKALAAGADATSSNQRLGQAYERLNRRGEAVSAYNRAVRAYEAALQSGRGDPARLRAGLGATQQALRLLQGN